MSRAETALKEIRALLENAWQHDDSEGQTLVEIEARLGEYYREPLRPLPEF
jgi:hypothetical protein